MYSEGSIWDDIILLILHIIAFATFSSFMRVAAARGVSQQFERHLIFEFAWVLSSMWHGTRRYVAYEIFMRREHRARVRRTKARHCRIVLGLWALTSAGIMMYTIKMGKRALQLEKADW